MLMALKWYVHTILNLKNCMSGYVRLPAPEIVAASLAVGHTFPPEKGFFRWPLLAIDDG